ncbi:MAG: T9SS type A sorting domain-containing protein [Chitinophagaceae bacterium]|nr:T9SS type A sorting domain-containing protein [Chitinophagaceae bacterium]
MKTILTFKKYVSRMLVIVLLFASKEGFSQPEYSFTGGTLTSGTALTVGATYRYNNVRPGIDAVLQITAITPGIGLTELDGSSGYPATIQPTITANAWTNGYVEMTVTFKTGGTNTNMNQPELAVTAFDVDGVINHDGNGHDLHEFDQFNLGGGYANYNTVASELMISGPASNWWTGTNVSGVDYPGRDTSAQQVMFSVINVNVTTAIIRVGINNQTSRSASRLRAVYFKKFVYNNALLAFNTVPKIVREKQVEIESSFKVYPTNMQNSATIAVQAEENGMAMFELVDYSGRVMHKQMISVSKGINNVPFNKLSGVSSGSYVAVLKMNGMVYNQKVIKQL